MYNVNDSNIVVKIKKIILTEVKGGYDAIGIRPYELDINYDDISMLSKLVEKTMVKKCSVASIMDINKLNFLTPSSRIIGTAPIVGGWGESRFKLDLVIELKVPGSDLRTLDYVQGYTSYFGKTQGGYIDDNMEIYINSITDIRCIKDCKTNIEKFVVISNNAVAFDETGYNQTLNNDDLLRVSRPDDLTSRISAINEPFNDETCEYNINKINELQIVNKDYVTPLDFISSLISATIESTNTYGHMYNSQNDILDAITGELLFQVPTSLDFYKMLSNVDVNDLNNITFKDLALLDSDIPEIEFKDQTCDKYAKEVFSINRDTLSNLNDDKIETVLSLLIEVTLSKFMSEKLIDEIAFTIDNKSGKPDYNLKMAKSIIYKDEDLTQIGNEVISLFIYNIWNKLSSNNDHQLSIDICNIGTEVVIKINLDKNEELTYLYPTFADSKYLPIITNNNKIEENIDVFSEMINVTIETIRNEMTAIEIT